MKKYIKKFFNRSPWKVAGDLIFWILLVMLLIPGTRSILMEGVSKVRALVMPLTVKTDQAPVLSSKDWQWNLTNAAGKKVPLSRFRGQVILINQWATWCPPCRAEMPSLEKLYREMGSRVTFIILSQEDSTVIEPYIRQKKFTFSWFTTREPMPEKLQTRSIPATAIISRKGQVVIFKKGAYNWNSARIRKLLERLLTEE